MTHPLLDDILHELRRHKRLADRAIAELDDQQFVQRPVPQVNPVALIVKHLAGNLTSRWTDLLTSDGDKPTRDRDAEFVLTEADTRAALTQAWEHGWQTIVVTVESLTPADLAKTIAIRGEVHTVEQALLRGLTHAAYHVGQILYVARIVKPDAPYQTIAPGQSGTHKAAYRRSAP
jgi:uncharacterized damage-inducible protein DinB